MRHNIFWLLIIFVIVSKLFVGCSLEKNTLGPNSTFSRAPDYIDPIHLYNYYALRNEETFASYEDALAAYSRNYTYSGLQQLRKQVNELGLKELFEYIAQKVYNAGVEYYDINYKMTALQYFKHITQKLPTTSYADDALYYVILCDIAYNDYSDIIRAGFDIIRRYPESPYQAYAYYSIGISYYKMKDYDNAQRYFTDLTKLYPHTQYADDGYYFLGQIAYEKRDYSTAYNYYRTVVTNYPNSDFRYSAQQKIDYILKNNLITL